MIYIRITEYLVLLLNDTVVKSFLRVKTLVDKYTCIFCKTALKKFTTHATEVSYAMMSWRYAVNDKCIVSSPPYLSRTQPKLVTIVDDMPSLTNAFFLRQHHIWRMVPLGVYRWIHAL